MRKSANYAAGDCHVCKQRKVKVRLLSCGKHNYCRMCAEFDPHISDGNLTCKICYSSHRKRNDKIEKFLSVHTEAPNDNSGANVTSAANALFRNDEADDENDLDGLNNEWDHLLQTIVTPSPTPPSPLPEKENDVTSESKHIGIPKKSSFLRLVLPSATNNSSATSPSASTHLMPKNISELLSDKLGSAMASVPEKESDASDNNDDESQQSHMRQPEALTSDAIKRFAPDPSEKERGTSPCKGMRWAKRANYRCYDSPVSNAAETHTNEPIENENKMDEPTVNEDNVFDHMTREMGEIEGPGFDSTSSSRSGSMTSLQERVPVFDAFWDA